MTTDNATVNDEVYDPDAPPEGGGFITDFYGRLVTSVMVADNNINDVEPHIRKSVEDYWETAKRHMPVWFLEAHGVSVIRTDGQPFRQSDIIALTDKNGKWLGKKMTPDNVATQYRGLGVSSSYTRVGQADSAVGRIFHFQAKEFAFGKGKRAGSKTISLWPTEVFPADYQYTGEITEVEPRSNDDDSNGASPAAPQVSQADATNILREVLVGKAPTEMFDAVMSDARLRAVGKVFGVGLIEAATDETLTSVLVENNVLVVGEDGKFAVPA